MGNHLIADRYARALSGAIEDDGVLQQELDRLYELSELFSTHHDLHSCLSNPAIDAALRVKVLDEVLDSLEITGPCRNLAHELLERGRMALLAEIVQAFSDLVDERLDRVTAVVTTALPLTDEQKDTLTKGLAAYSNKNVRLRCEVDAELIGGVVVRIGGEVLDGSLRTQLDNLKDTLIAAELDPGHLDKTA